MSRAPGTKYAPGAPSSAADWRVLAVAVVLMLAALGAYWNSFGVPFLLDDKSAIGDNPTIRHLGRIGAVLSPSLGGPTASRPLLNLTFALNCAAGGLSVRGYHAVNLLIHICAALALFGIVRRTLLLPGLRPHPSDMGGTPMDLGCGMRAALRHRYGEAALPLAAFAALIWTLHPVQTESVTYISQRAESLMGLFYLLTIYGFIRSVDVGRDRRILSHQTRNPAGFGDPALQQSATGRGTLWLVLSVTACLCGMATKQVMVTAPVLVLLYDRVFVSGSFRSALANRRWYYASLAATWLWLGFLMHHSSLTEAGAGFQAGVSWTTYALTELRVVTNYLKLAFWPDPLVFDYGTEIFVTDPLKVLPFALIIAAILGSVAIALRRSPMVGFLGGWFFLILAPTSTVVPVVQQPMAESRMYLPLAGVVVLVTLVSHALGRRRAFVALAAVAVGLGALTVRRNHDYRNEVSIWEDTIAKLPRASRGHSSLGSALVKMPGRVPDAIAHYEEALRLNPANAEAHVNLAIELAKIPGQLPAAIAHHEAALRVRPDFAEAHNNLAIALTKMPGRGADAIAHYEEALRVKPDLAEARYNLAIELTKTPDRLADAIAHYEEALSIKPDYAEAHNNLAIGLAKIPGRLPDAIAHYQEALRLKPDYAEAYNNLADVLAKMPGQLPEAIAHGEMALRLKPDFAEAHYNLANALAKTPGRLTDAVAHYEDALRLQPVYADAHYNLANALAKTPGRLNDAIAHYEEAVRLNPGFVEARNNLAAIYAETGRLDAAIDQLEIAARLDPTSGTIRGNLKKMKALQKQ